MDELNAKLEDAYREQLATAQRLRRALADLQAVRVDAEAELVLLQQKTAETIALQHQAATDGRASEAEEMSAVLRELQQRTVEAERKVQHLTDTEQLSMKKLEYLQFEIDKFRTKKEIFKAAMLTAELSGQVGDAVAALDRLMQELDAAIANYAAATAPKPGDD